MLTRGRRTAAAALGVAAALAVAALWASGVLAQRGEDHSAALAGVTTLQGGETLEGGRTYRVPDGSWLLDVPEGMRLSYGYTSESPAGGTHHGFVDLETGALIGIDEYGGGIQRGVNPGTPAERALAEARLDRVEAGFRRPPDYLEAPAAQQASEPQLSPDGIPYLAESEPFTGGVTYTIRGHEEWRIPMPAGLDGTFSMNWFTPDGTRHYGFRGAGWSVYLNPATGYTIGRSEPDQSAAIATLRATLTALVTGSAADE